jgi:uncharacterized membrane protein HdeD (DUF308 family)
MHAHPQRWWFWALRAVATTLFAIIAIAYPPFTSALAVHLYGAYVKLDGFVLIGMNVHSNGQRSWLLLAGLVALASGLTILVWPASDASALAIALGGLAILRGALEAADAFINQGSRRERRLRVFSAMLLVTFGLMLGVHSWLGLPRLVLGFALHATLAGLSQFAIAFEQARDARMHTPPPTLNGGAQAVISRMTGHKV